MHQKKPAKQRGAKAKDPKVWVPLVCRAYARTGRMIEACREAKMGYDLFSHWRKTIPWVAQEVEYAEAKYVERLEKEIDRRAVEGVQRPYLYKGEMVYERNPDTGELRRDSNNQPIPIMIHEYSDRMLELAAKAHAPDKYRENQKQVGDGVERVLVVPAQEGSTEDWMKKQEKRKANAA